MKPEQFRKNCVVMKETHYRVTDLTGKETAASEGVLSPGRVLWIEGSAAQSGKQIAAYAEGVGLITVDPEILSAA